MTDPLRCQDKFDVVSGLFNQVKIITDANVILNFLKQPRTKRQIHSLVISISTTNANLFYRKIKRIMTCFINVSNKLNHRLDVSCLFYWITSLIFHPKDV